MRSLVVPLLIITGVCTSSLAVAQDQPPDPRQHMNMDMAAPSAWQFMQDGIAFVEFNHQGSPRGGDELVAPNWWMGMASRKTAYGRLTFNAMLSLDPVTVGKSGYREIFQSGEALNGQPLVDRQHPHDLFMQLAAVWRLPVTDSTGFTLAGGPAGEPALGPVAFMHRASALDDPSAPLGHHTFDSTHIAFGVVTAAVDHGPWLVEGSVFNGREPDENRWDFDFGRLDSVSGRIWFRPNDEWEFQASSGHLTDPEQLEPGDIVRSTVSASWTRVSRENLTAATVGFGHNSTEHGKRNAFLVEGATKVAGSSGYLRFELLQVEAALLAGTATDDQATVAAFTLGAVRDVLHAKGFEGGFGADFTVYRAPADLVAAYGEHPLSFHVFFRLRPPAGAMGRMWNMRMSEPMRTATMPGMKMN